MIRKMIRGAAWLLIFLLLTACGKENEMGSVRENTEETGQPETENRTEPVKETDSGTAGKQAELRISGFDSKIMLQKLEPDLLLDFAYLYTSTQQFEEKCVLPVPVTREQAGLLMSLLHTECPELFQYDVAADYGLELSEEMVLSISVPYGMNQATYEERMKYCRIRMDDFRERIADCTDPYEQEEQIYRLICRLTEYDKKFERASDASGVLVEGRGKCDGISLAFKWIMDELGIPCVVVTGNSINQENPLGHAWNLVKPGEKWRLVDVTQDTSEEGGNDPMYPLYNSSDDWLAGSYETPESVRSLGIPACTGMEESYHVKNGSYFTGAEAREGLFATLERALKEDGSALLQYESPEAWEEFRENADTWAGEWMEEKGLYGHTAFASMDSFHVAQIRLEINQNSLTLNSLEEQINERQTWLDAEKNGLDAEAAELDQMYDRMTALRQEAEALAAAYPQGMDEAAKKQYNSLVEQYNSRLDEYNSRAQKYEERVKKFEEARDECNAMIQSFNAMAAQGN